MFSAEQMHQAVDALLEALTHRPVNPDNSQAFTLYSLKICWKAARTPATAGRRSFMTGGV